jgi:hypothetical protein
MKSKGFTYKLFFAMLAFMPALYSYAQVNAYEQLKSINDANRLKASFAFNIDYLIYGNYTTQKTESSTRSVYVKQNNLVLNKGEQTIVFQNEEKLIVVNLKDKKIYLAKPVKDILQNASLKDIEKSLTKDSDLQMTEKDKLKVFTVSFKSPASEYEKIVIQVNKNTSHIQKYIMYLREEMKMNFEDPSCKAEKPRMEVNISPSNSLADEYKSYMNESYYIQKTKGAYIPSSGFKGFKVINNIVNN